MFNFAQGEDIALALDAVGGDMTAVSSVVAAMKPLAPGATVPDPAAVPVGYFAVSARAATDGVPGGWTLTVAGPQSAALPEGYYIADARLNIGSAVVVTQPVGIRLRRPVTGAGV